MTTRLLTVRKADGTEVHDAFEVSHTSLEMVIPVFKINDLPPVGVKDSLTVIHVFRGLIRGRNKTFATFFVNNGKPASRAIVLDGTFSPGEKLTVTRVSTA